MNTIDLCTVVITVYLICIVFPHRIHDYRGEAILCAILGAIIAGVWFRNLISIWIGATAGLSAVGLHDVLASKIDK